MSRKVEAIYKDGRIQLLEPLHLPDETRLTVTIEEPLAELERDTARRKLDPLATIHELARDAGPADLARNLDHYLYGVPKR